MTSHDDDVSNTSGQNTNQQRAIAKVYDQIIGQDGMADELHTTAGTANLADAEQASGVTPNWAVKINRFQKCKNSRF